MPALLTKQEKPVNSDKIEENGSNTSEKMETTPETISEYPYNQYGIIKLLHKKTSPLSRHIRP